MGCVAIDSVLRTINWAIARADLWRIKLIQYGRSSENRALPEPQLRPPTWKMKTLSAVLCLSVTFALTPRADAAISLLSATIDGAQASAGSGTGSLGVGTMTGSYDDGGTPLTGGTFSWNIEWSGLSGTVTVAHFHGAALPNQNAGVQLGISDVTSPSPGSAGITAIQWADLRDGLWYINIHSTVNTGGEIRGNIVPEPSRGLLALIGLLPLALMRRRR